MPTTEMSLYPVGTATDGLATTYRQENFYPTTEGDSVTTTSTQIFTVVASASGWTDADQACQFTGDGQGECFDLKVSSTFTGASKSVVFELGVATSSSGSSTQTTPTSNQASQTSTTAIQSDTSAPKSHSKVGALVGGIIGGFCAVGIVFLFIIWLNRRRRLQSAYVQSIKESTTSDSRIIPFVTSNLTSSSVPTTLENSHLFSSEKWRQAQGTGAQTSEHPVNPRTGSGSSRENHGEDTAALHHRIAEMAERLRILEEQGQSPPDYTSQA
ncbi:hypothetical protein BDP27DRAFT_1313053 [Rhodocollybia butyracea]|uniref:Uncharacterized protein n=1 Tax=Rhodocollybia butyracea TaxID=206335 RepID=A0A9P5UEA8_9AGAR|nr:hypothetical protein BDP27DRAFT_1313053 [Rhodocollybia butyracea]